MGAACLLALCPMRQALERSLPSMLFRQFIPRHGYCAAFCWFGATTCRFRASRSIRTTVHALRSGFDAIMVQSFFVLLFNACAKKTNMEPAKSGQFVTATYQVSVENQSEFLILLRKAETVMRAEALITPWPAIRMRSKKDPEFILEIL